MHGVSHEESDIHDTHNSVTSSYSLLLTIVLNDGVLFNCVNLGKREKQNRRGRVSKSSLNFDFQCESKQAIK